MVDIIDKIFQLAGGFADERPHLFAVLVADVHIREVIGELFANLLQPIPELGETLPDFLQVNCESVRGEMTATDRHKLTPVSFSRCSKFIEEGFHVGEVLRDCSLEEVEEGGVVERLRVD